MLTKILPVNIWEIPKINLNLNYNYISNLIANNLIKDYFLPSQIKSPFFSNINELNEKIGILQTATNGINTILNYIDILKNINPNEKEVINDLTNEINSIIKNTTFESLPVFNQTLKIEDQNINLSIMMFNLNKTSIEDYEKLLTQKQKDIFNILDKITFQSPLNKNFNPFDTETFESIINSNLLTTAYKENIINPQTLELLFS